MRAMTSRIGGIAMLLGIAAASWAEPPVLEHQPSPCTVPAKAVSLCATITDDSQVAKARIYFRATGEKYWNVVDMAFGGISFCGTLPAPHTKAQSVEYYVQAIDDEFETQRTSTYQLRVQGDGQCGFPPVETDTARASAITVYATHKKQGDKIDDHFERAGVTFVPVQR
jgi:hypothetical protein